MKRSTTHPPWRALCAGLLLVPLPSLAFEITYEGDFSLDGRTPAAITHNAIPVTRYVSVVTTISPVTDAHDQAGDKHCWYMIDRQQGLKAMIAERPIERVGPEPFGVNAPRPSDAEISSIAAFVKSVYHEAEESGGVKKLSENCAKPRS